MKKKSKSVFLIQIYRRKNKEENQTLPPIFGAFSTEEKARKWVEKYGKEAVKGFAKGYSHKDLFFCVLEYLMDRPEHEWGVAVSALDSNGKPTYFFCP
jgi:hypothetical protein